MRALLHVFFNSISMHIVSVGLELCYFCIVPQNGECCLHFPETLKNFKLMQYLLRAYTLLDCSIDIPSHTRKYTPLMVACAIGDDVALTIKLLLESGAGANGNSDALNRPLVEASGCGSMKVVQELLNHWADPDIQDASGTTALLKACQNKQPNMAAFLIENGVNVNLSDHDGTTPLFAAVTTNSYFLIQKLIQKGAKVNTTRVLTNPVMFGSVEETPLSHACARGFLDITDYLIQNNADVNYLCGGTVSPLGHAIILNRMHIVKFLLKNKSLDTSPYGVKV
jgi:ankyrin repeat protein